MNYREFFISIIIDIYGDYLTKWGNVDIEDFDLSFFDENGNVISDFDYFKSHSDFILTDTILRELYLYIINLANKKEINLEKIISFLSSTFMVYEYDKKNPVIKFIQNSSLKNIINLFKENIDFGISLIKSYFESELNNRRYYINRKKIYENGEQNKLTELENKALEVEVISINEILRNTIVNLYNYYISNGCNDSDALNYTWMYFLNDFDPIGALNKMGYNFYTKRKLQNYTICLIYSDLYEDICNKPILTSEKQEDIIIQIIVNSLVHLNLPAIPKDENLRNRLLKYFIMLQDEKEKKKENRKKTYTDGRIQVLKKVNPSYILDELT